MEQHMFSYMNQRFGLKQLIIENIASLLRAVGNYAEKDNDVAVFQKIVSNDIDVCLSCGATVAVHHVTAYSGA